jgi:murein DD-endopeptidase MepM/ murein hydrolase activator NlpD
VAAGIVTFAGERNGYGFMVEINHGNGFVTRYGHNSRVLVKPGDRVLKGQRVALVGSTGRSTGPHVHFEVLRNGVVVNPSQYIRAAS